jgi:hypothetical protein
MNGRISNSLNASALRCAGSKYTVGQDSIPQNSLFSSYNNRT